MKELREGDLAPAFEAKDQHGNTVSLNDFRGKTVILYFYPKDDTPGCTAEACNFRDNHQALIDKGYAVLGVSVDDEKSHGKFSTKYSLPFSLLADTDQKIVQDYGVWVEKNNYGKTYMGIARTTFVIDPEGKIVKIVTKVDNPNATQQLLDLMG